MSCVLCFEVNVILLVDDMELEIDVILFIDDMELLLYPQL